LAVKSPAATTKQPIIKKVRLIKLPSLHPNRSTTRDAGREATWRELFQGISIIIVATFQVNIVTTFQVNLGEFGNSTISSVAG
jgi:hypothetical protein